MLWIYFLQWWFNSTDPAVEDALVAGANEEAGSTLDALRLRNWNFCGRTL